MARMLLLMQGTTKMPSFDMSCSWRTKLSTVRKLERGLWWER
jgi:hypothetical protein